MLTSPNGAPRKMVSRVVHVKRPGINFLVRNRIKTPLPEADWILLDIDEGGVQSIGASTAGEFSGDSWNETLNDMLSALNSTYDFDERGWIEMPDDEPDWLKCAKERFPVAEPQEEGS